MLSFLDNYAGQLAGVSTALLWTGTTLFFTAAVRRIGAVTVNTVRIFFAVGLLGIAHRVLTGVWFPEASGYQVALLAFSGFVGLSVGDQALFVAFADIGPRLATLIMATSPLFAALLGWLVLGEALETLAWLGMLMTIAGVAWVVLERSDSGGQQGNGWRARGIGMAVVAAACQAGGLLLSKQGMGHGWLPQDKIMPAQTATFIRMVFAAIGMFPIVALYLIRVRRKRVSWRAGSSAGSLQGGMFFAFAGAVFGPFLGVWMSLVAADRAPLGVAQTLCSSVPIFMIPAAAIIYGERVTLRAALGAIVAVAGCALLFA